ncbi:MAG: hypothetical protein ACXWXN_04785 [Actinomycetota bacterium]
MSDAQSFEEFFEIESPTMFRDRERFRIFKMRPDGSDRTLIAALPASPRFLDWGSLAES